MFSTSRSTSAVEPAREVAPVDPVPLSVLALDLGVPPEGWASFLGKRGVAIVPDCLGRNAIGHDAARRLLDERRADELRAARHLAAAELEAVEADAAWRASLPKGIPLDRFVPGASYAELARAAELAGVPKRRSLVEESLSGESGTYHSYQSMSEGA